MLAMIVWLIAAIVVGGQLTWIALATDAGLVVIIEVLLALNVIPSVRKIRRGFQNLPFDLRILATGGREVYRTDVSRKVDNTTLYRMFLAAPRKEDGTTMNARSDSLPDDALKIYRLHAGVAALAEDAQELDMLQQTLESKRDLLTEQNEILLKQHALNSVLYRQQREHELSERVEHDLTAAATQIRTILDNGLPPDEPELADERRKQLNLVKVLVAYCKRKGMLALAGAESDAMSGTQLNTIAHEAMTDLRSVGIECAVLVEAHDDMAVSAVNTIYDSFYDCVISVLPRTTPVLMVYLSQSRSLLKMRANIECGIGLENDTAVEMIPRIATSTEPWTSVQMDIARDLEERLALRDGDHLVTLDDGLVSVMVTANAEIVDDANAGKSVLENESVGTQAAHIGADYATTADKAFGQDNRRGATL